MNVELPEYDEVERKVKELGLEELDPVERFIYENEPAGIEDETRFRKELQSMLDYVIEHPAINKKPIINQPQGSHKG